MSGNAIVTTDESARTTPTATASSTTGVRTTVLALEPGDLPDGTVMGERPPKPALAK